MTELARRGGATLVRFNSDGRPAPDTLIYAGPGAIWWEDHPGKLRDRVRVAQKRNQVVVLLPQSRLAVTRQHLPLDGVLVRQLKAPRPRWVKPALITTGVLTALSIPVVLIYILVQAIWEARTTLTTIGVAVVILWLLIKGLLGHSAICPGLHCSGCKG